MKRYKKNTPAPKATIESVLDASIETLSLGITAIREQIELIASGKGPKSKHDKGSRIAFLTGKVGAIADSIRKIEAARAKRLDDITPAIALAWLRSLDATERAQFLREASQLDARKSGLA